MTLKKSIWQRIRLYATHKRVAKFNQQLDMLLCQACAHQLNPHDVSIQIQNLLEQGASIDLQGNWGTKRNTLLLFAIYSHNPELCQYLLLHNADVNQANANGVTPLWLAVSRYDTLIPKLIKHGAKVNCQDKQGITPLMQAAKYDKHRIVTYLLNKGAKIDVTDKHRQSVLFYTGGNFQITKTLLERGAKPTQESLSGKTPLFFAQDPQVAEILLEYGTDVNKQDLERRTPLMVMVNNPKLVKILLDHGADPTIHDSMHDTALHFAQNPQSIRLLVQAGADIDAHGFGNETPLLRLAKNPYVSSKTIQALLKYQPMPLSTNFNTKRQSDRPQELTSSADILSVWSYIRDPKIKTLLLNYQEKWQKKAKRPSYQTTSCHFYHKRTYERI